MTERNQWSLHVYRDPEGYSEVVIGSDLSAEQLVRLPIGTEVTMTIVRKTRTITEP
jgi:hypothetical protein